MSSLYPAGKRLPAVNWSIHLVVRDPHASGMMFSACALGDRAADVVAAEALGRRYRGLKLGRGWDTCKGREAAPDGKRLPAWPRPPGIIRVYPRRT